MSGGADLKARREALGWTLEDVARATRIPVEHVAAVEEGRLHELPDGPWAQAYERAIREHLGVDAVDVEPSDASTPEIAPPPGLPLWAVRAVATVSVLALLGVMGWEARVRLLGPPQAVDPLAGLQVAPDQNVRVVTRRNARLKVMVDGEVVLDRVVPGGEDLTFSAHDRIEIDIPAASAARLEYNGRTIVPQGRQDAPRKLVFIDDVQVRIPGLPAGEGAP